MSLGRVFQKVEAATENERRPTVDRRLPWRLLLQQLLVITSSVRPSTPFSADTDTPIFCCQSNTIPIRYEYASRAGVINKVVGGGGGCAGVHGAVSRHARVLARQSAGARRRPRRVLLGSAAAHVHATQRPVRLRRPLPRLRRRPARTPSP